MSESISFVPQGYFPRSSESAVESSYSRYRNDSESVPDTKQTESYRFRERFSNEESFSIEVMTKEGDKVEISFSSEMEYSAKYAYSENRGGSSEFYKMEQSASSEFGFSVEGDLNVDEIDAIAGLVQEISLLADRFFAGDMTGAFQQASSMTLDNDLASMNLSMEQNMNYRAVEQYRAVQAMEPQEQAAQQIQPYAQMVAEQVGRSEQRLSSASDFTFTLMSELILRDSRAEETAPPEALDGALMELRNLVDSIIAQYGEPQEVEVETDEAESLII